MVDVTRPFSRKAPLCLPLRAPMAKMREFQNQTWHSSLCEMFVDAGNK